MLRKLLSFIPGRSKMPANKRYELNIIPRDQHCISRQAISESAKKVLYRLNKAGYEAYLVGGGVRDLLLGGEPKDFDIATDATPEEVHDLFRNSRLIGRRFKIVHVLFGREVIEVTTFRGGAEASEDNSQRAREVNEHGLLVRDNVFGTTEEDALRRDFTVNALYYCIQDFTVRDYANGVEDLQNRQLRLIGDPETRYREDPVRMLRAIRFAAKLSFDIAPDTADPIRELAPLLDHIPPARLFEEVLKLFSAGYGEATYELLLEYGLFQALFPQTHRALETQSDEVIRKALRNTDDRIRNNKSVTPYFMFAALLWPALQVEWQRMQDNGEPPLPALHAAAHQVVERQVRSTAIPRRFSVPMKEIWELQARLPKRHGKRAEALFGHPRFRASYDFLLVRESAGEPTEGLGQWWTDYQEVALDERNRMVNELTPRRPRSRKRRSKSPK